jgi:hypothetical protein
MKRPADTVRRGRTKREHPKHFKNHESMTALGNLVNSHPTMADELPLIHTSLSEHLKSFVSSHTLLPSHCKVFDESLVYLFYGRPAYRSNRGSNFGDPVALCPVCFVFKPRTVSSALHRVLPCDSGAVNKPMFQPELHPSDLPDLELNPVIESARRLVSLVFETNKKYFYGEVRAGVSFPAGTVGKRYCDLMLRSGPVGYDDRKSAIEIQVNQIVSLKDQLSFVVLPREFLEETAIQDAIFKTWKCDAIEYPTFSGDAPTAYYSVVRNEVAKRFEAEARL